MQLTFYFKKSVKKINISVSKIHTYSSCFVLSFVGYIGVAKDIVEILNHKKVDNRDDDQLYFTKIFLDKALRVSMSLKFIFEL